MTSGTENLAAMRSPEQHETFVRGVFQKHGEEAKRLLLIAAQKALTFDGIYDRMAELNDAAADAFKAAAMNGTDAEIARLVRAWRDDVIAAYIAAHFEDKVWELNNGGDD